MRDISEKPIREAEILMHAVGEGRMKKPLWTPSEERVKKANITHFIDHVNEKHGLSISSYNDLYQWSIEETADFWAAMWEYGNIQASRKYNLVVDDLHRFPGANWFVGATLNFAENLLQRRDDRTALTFRNEAGKTAEITYAGLYHSVASLAQSLQNAGVTPGDRVAAYMPSLIQTATAMLAATSIGAVWSSCGTELGAQAVVDRLGQIEPKVLFTVDSYVYKGKTFDFRENIKTVAKGVPSFQRIIVIPYMNERPVISKIPKSQLYDDFVSGTGNDARFEQLPSNHPLYIMFSSGTTGKPKSIVQGSAGILINHLKELTLHSDLKPEDRIFYITTPSWMMWNWLLSSLAVGATIMLYDGSPTYPDWNTVWKLVQDGKITVFGCSASYINYLRTVGAQPSKHYDLSSLKEISQTGSPLSSDGFEYVYREIKQDLHFNSIAGGTDINGCFVAGTPMQPVYAGELQGPALGMKIKAYDETGNLVHDQRGELVCEMPAPCMPLRFWNDRDGTKYRATYFNIYPNVWRHGDWIIIHSDTGGIAFLGRSDFTLKPLGVRIGPAEIYNVIEMLDEIADSVVVGQDWKGDQRIVLFVKLAPKHMLTEDLKNKIKRSLREQASPRHVPAIILEVSEIPYTFNMKKVESAVANIINGRPVTNRDAIANPESLDFYEEMIPQLQKDSC
jgi:acetoacetyl-CoA synthetase